MKLLGYIVLVAGFIMAIPAVMLAQSGTITGKVIGSRKEPLERASVFLNNATYGTSTQADGTFSLSGIKPGQYDLVVSSVGYELYSQTVLVGKAPIHLDIELKQKVAELRDVVITTPEGWKRNYDMFVKYFIGTGADAKKCRILNPHDLYMVYHKATQTLEASSDDFIIIENDALGYREKMLLKEFKYSGADEMTEWEVRMLYEELPGSKAQKTIWQQRRDDVYYGSQAHFFRSMATGQMVENGFEIRTLVRKPNKLRPPDKVVKQKLEHFRGISRDSMIYWIDKQNLPKWDDKLIKRPMLADEIFHHTEQPGIFYITFKDLLYVTYKNRYETEAFRDVYHPLDMENFEATVITLLKPFAAFDSNGTTVNGLSFIVEGSWTKNKGAEILPLDFTPVGKPPSIAESK